MRRNRASLMPSIIISSSTLLNGPNLSRYSMIFPATTGPTCGRRRRSSADAVLIFSCCDEALFSSESSDLEFEISDLELSISDPEFAISVFAATARSSPDRPLSKHAATDNAATRRRKYRKFTKLVVSTFRIFQFGLASAKPLAPSRSHPADLRTPLAERAALGLSRPCRLYSPRGPLRPG